ncbi:MAG: hypothetical protein WCP33_04070 [Deltaproteobacteria bacterium]
MNTRIIHKPNVKENVLDDLSRELPIIISQVMEVPGGNLAILKPEQIALEFTPASSRDVGSDIRIMAFARSNDPRASKGNDLAKAVLEKVAALISKSGSAHSVDIRVYLLEVGAAVHLRS